MKENNRVLWIDIIRSFAIICVVMCHVTEIVYPLNMDYIVHISFREKLLAFTLFTFGRLGVPFFLFISGYLLLDRSYKDQGIQLFWKKNLLRLFISVEIWIIIYNLFLKLLKNREITITILVKNMLFLKSIDAVLSHTWYIPMILGIYLFLPFVADILHQTDFTNFKFPLRLIWIYLFVLPVIDIISRIYGHEVTGLLSHAYKHEAETSLLWLDFSGGVYGFYLIMGYMLKKDVLKRLQTLYLWLLGVVLFAGIVSLQLFSYNQGYAYNVWYNNAFLCLGAMMFFEIFSRLHIKKEYQFWKSLSKYSFGIFLLHNPVMLILNECKLCSEIPSIKIVQLFIGSMVISWLITAVFSKIPVLGRWLFYIK